MIHILTFSSYSKLSTYYVSLLLLYERYQRESTSFLTLQFVVLNFIFFNVGLTDIELFEKAEYIV